MSVTVERCPRCLTPNPFYIVWDWMSMSRIGQKMLNISQRQNTSIYINHKIRYIKKSFFYLCTVRSRPIGVWMGLPWKCVSPQCLCLGCFLPLMIVCSKNSLVRGHFKSVCVCVCFFFFVPLLYGCRIFRLSNVFCRLSLLQDESLPDCACVFLRTCVCVCVCERERERERESVS